MKKYLKLMRVKHYLKNILVFLPLFFSNNLFNLKKMFLTIVGVIAFCLISSAVYIINDIMDIDKDRKHPIKKNRPIASGQVSIKKAVILASFLVVLSLLIVSVVCIYFMVTIIMPIIYILLYILLNILYSIGLKNKPILDVVILVSGFLIRVLFGGVIINVKISEWLYLTIIAISFYLGLGKRRNEFVKHNKDDTRKVLNYYTKEFLNKNMYVCMSLAIIFYSLWSMNYPNTWMIWTVPIVIILAMKYSLDIESNESEGDPTDVILKDKTLILMGTIFAIILFIIVYFMK